MKLVDLRGQLPRAVENTPSPARHAKDSWTVHWEGCSCLADELADPVSPGVVTDQEAALQLRAHAEHHIRKDWGAGSGGSGLMYAYAIAPSGTVFRTRDEDEVLWHAGNADGNRTSVPVLVMSGPGIPHTSAQLEALGELLTTHEWTIYGHRDWPGSATSCPGDELHAELQRRTDERARWIRGTPIFRPPTCTQEQFERHLRSHPSPALAEAPAIFALFVAAGIDPAIALGFFHHESACGTRGRAVTTKSWGNLRWKILRDGRQPYASLSYSVRDVDGFCAYETWHAGARHFADHLMGTDGTDFYRGRGLDTVEEVVPVWAPAADGNDPAGYVKAVLTVAREVAALEVPPPADVFWGRPDGTPLTLGDLREYARRLQDQLDREYVRK